MSRLEIAMEKAALLRQGVEAPQAAAAEQGLSRPERRAVPVSPQYGKLCPENPFLVNLHDPHSPTAEEYRKLKSVLVKVTTGASFRNSLAVTSSVPSEGKSLTALNLALSLAQDLDHTVLLVDADLRRPSVHRYLNLEQGPGFAEVLTGEADIGETIIATGLGKLSIIRAGRCIDNPTEIFSSQRTKAIMEELKHRYPDRYIIYDTPPVLPFAESRTLANQVDGVVFVIMERLASQSNVKDALDSLKGCPILGTVFNAATVDNNDGRYSYYGAGRKKDQVIVNSERK